jgi:DNA-binding transcriptional LysR family regulator
LPVIAVETNSVGAQLSFVAKGRLLGWLPHPLIESELASGAVGLLTISELTLHRRFFVYRRRRGSLPAAARQMLQFLPLARAETGMAAFAPPHPHL